MYNYLGVAIPVDIERAYPAATIEYFDDIIDLSIAYDNTYMLHAIHGVLDHCAPDPDADDAADRVMANDSEEDDDMPGLEMDDGMPGLEMDGDDMPDLEQDGEMQLNGG